MTTYFESGLEISPPSGCCFRFCDIDEYRKLSGRNLKEIDFGWWDDCTGRLILLEIKGKEVWNEVRQAGASTNSFQFLVSVLTQKVVDSVAMLSALWIGTDWGVRVRRFLPQRLHEYVGDGRLRVVFLLDTALPDKALLGVLRDRVNAKLAGKLALLGLSRVTVTDFETGARMGLPVRRPAVDTSSPSLG